MQDILEETREPARHPTRLLLAGLALGCAFDVLFNGKLPGISVPLFALLLMGGLLLALRWEGARALAANAWLPVALLFFAAMCALRANGFLTFLNISACLMILAVIAVYLAQSSAAGMGLPALPLAPLEAVLLSLLRAGQATAQAWRHNASARPQPTRKQAIPWLRGLLLAVPVLLLFTALLASADLIFADRLEHLLSPEFLQDVGRGVGHILLVLSAGFLLAGGLVYAVQRRASTWAERLRAMRLPRFPGITEAAVVINATNLLFALFVVIQVPYLFGGRVNVVAGKFTYAEYARRGFGELVMVAILTLGLVVVLSALTQRASRRQRLVFNASATVLLGLTCVLLASAFKRLLMYEEAYGFSQMRIYPHVFMVWLGILLAWFVVTLWLRPDRFAIGVLVAALGFVATLDVMNPDAFVVRQNVRHPVLVAAPTAGGGEPNAEIDVSYFERLSEDAVPALIAALDQTTGKERQAIETDLNRRAKGLRAGPGWRRWPSYNFARSRAYRILMEHGYGQE